MSERRPQVSVVVPFAGSDAELAETAERLRDLQRATGDELIIADNRPESRPFSLDAVRVVAAPEQRSSYYARNVGAEQAANDWILFMDADCRPVQNILDAYFAQPVE